MALSDQLMDLANRTKQLEDAVDAAKARDRARLEEKREKLHSAMETEAQNLQSSTSQAETAARSWWADTTMHMEERRAELRAKLDERRAERQLERAQRNAADAEDYAADAVTMAAYVIDNAEYAVVDAVLARAEADDLAAGS